jgi:hypothetical protein
LTTAFFASSRYDFPLGLETPGALIASTSTLCFVMKMLPQPPHASVRPAPITHASIREKQPEGFMRLTAIRYTRAP